MATGVPDGMDPVDSWLLRRVAQAVEAGDVSQDLLAELQAELETSREKPPERCRAVAARHFAVELQMPIEKVDAGLAALEAQPRVILECLMRWIAGARLEAQRKASRQQRETR